MTQSKPSLVAVLEHYGITVDPVRVTQMVACLLHDDHTPSCSIDTDRDLWRCHSCGKGGDSYSLIMEKEGVDFVRARALAASVGLATRGDGGSDSGLSGSRYGRRRQVPARPRDRPANGTYVPAWRRR
ncbi:CHC2 zinc finger domain-containing protein [Actinoplanes oblitus]|uniref:CHC2 zinc finger domain-containing protein n=1 Tax=Actinoplanes oblitus TaxID=3040509 RepID=UPI003898ED79